MANNTIKQVLEAEINEDISMTDGEILNEDLLLEESRIESQQNKPENPKAKIIQQNEKDKLNTRIVSLKRKFSAINAVLTTIKQNSENKENEPVVPEPKRKMVKISEQTLTECTLEIRKKREERFGVVTPEVTKKIQHKRQTKKSVREPKIKHREVLLKRQQRFGGVTTVQTTGTKYTKKQERFGDLSSEAVQGRLIERQERFGNKSAVSISLSSYVKINSIGKSQFRFRKN